MKIFRIICTSLLIIALSILFSSCNDKGEKITPQPTNTFKFVVSNNFFPNGGYICLQNNQGEFLKSIKVGGDGTYEFKDIENINYTITLVRKNPDNSEFEWKLRTMHDVKIGTWSLIGENHSNSSLGRVKLITQFPNTSTPAFAVNSIPYQHLSVNNTDSTQHTTFFDVYKLSNEQGTKLRILGLAVNEDLMIGNCLYIEPSFDKNQYNQISVTLTDPVVKEQIYTVGDITLNNVRLFTNSNPGLNNTPSQKILHYKKNFVTREPAPYIYHAPIMANDYFVLEATFNKSLSEEYKILFKSLKKPRTTIEYLGSTLKANYNAVSNKIENIILDNLNISDIVISEWGNVGEIKWALGADPSVKTHFLPQLSSEILIDLGIPSVEELSAINIATVYQSNIATYNELVPYVYSDYHGFLGTDTQRYEYIKIFE